MYQNGLYLLNVFHSQYVRSISYGLPVAGGWTSVQLRKLLHVFGYRFNIVQFYFGETRKAHVSTATNTTQESRLCIIPKQRL
jgi:hypothetical protein